MASFNCSQDSYQTAEYRSHLSTLGLQPGASRSAIKAAYLRLVKQWHPDQFVQDPQRQQQAEATLKAINVAYGHLKVRVTSDPVTSPSEHVSSKSQATSVGVHTRRRSGLECYTAATQAMAEDRPDDALAALTAALRLCPNYAEAYRYRGFIYSMRGQDLRADSDLQRAKQFGVGYQPVARARAAEHHPVVATIPVPSTLQLRPLQALTLAPDLPMACHRQRLAIGDNQGEVRLLRLPQGRCIHRFQAHTAEVTALSFSPDGQLLFTAGADHMLKTWHLSSGNLLKLGLGHRGRVTALVPCDRRRHLVSVGQDGAMQVWAMATGKMLQQPVAHGAALTTLALSHDGEAALGGSQDGSLLLGHTLKGGLLKWVQPSLSAVVALAIDSDDQQVAVSRADGTVVLHPFPSLDRPTPLPPASAPVTHLCWLPHTSLLLGGDCQGNLHLWDTAHGQHRKTVAAHSGEALTHLHLFPEHRLGLSADRTGTVKLWRYRAVAVA